MELVHRETGERLTVHMRPLRREDVPAAIHCIRDAYGESYVKPYLYDEENLWEHHVCGALSFSVAEAGGGLAGIVAGEVSPLFPGLSEIACQVVLQRYGSYGLALPLARYQMEQAAKGDFSAQFARALGCHLISQKTLDDLGFTHCGFFLSVFDRTRLTTRYRTESNLKIPQTIAVKRQRAERTGAIFMPEECRSLARDMYQHLGVSWSGPEPAGAPPEAGRWAWSMDERHSTLLLVANRPGEDFGSCLARALDALGGRPLQTINLLLSLSCPGSAAAYAAARALGFVFTGFLPCGRDGEHLILHHPMGVGVDMGYIPRIPAYEPYVQEIRRQLHER